MAALLSVGSRRQIRDDCGFGSAAICIQPKFLQVCYQVTVYTAVQQKFASNDLEGSWTVSRVSHEQMEICVQTAREFILKALEKSCLLPVSEQVSLEVHTLGLT